MNRLYDYGRNEFLKGAIAWLNDDIRAVLLPATYVPNTETDQFLSSILVDDRISVSQLLYDKTAVAGVAGAAPTRCVDVLGAEVASVALFKDTGLDSTSPLIAYIDIASNLPIMPEANFILDIYRKHEGADLLIQWYSNLIFKL